MPRNNKSTSTVEPADVEPADLDNKSQPFIGRWNKLVTTTNWEKGRIINEWRAALIKGGAATSEYSDEAWSRRVGNVSPQHIGRLRRVYERFGDVWKEYKGLYWSHFHSSLEWNDSEMWLEGAVQSGWSVSQMRAARWEAIGAPPELKPRDEEIIVAEIDEDVAIDIDTAAEDSVTPTIDTVREPGQEETFGPDFGEEASDSGTEIKGSVMPEDSGQPLVRPFAELPEMPGDIAAAFESFKLAILHHKMSGWADVARDDVIATLDALKELALAP